MKTNFEIMMDFSAGEKRKLDSTSSLPEDTKRVKIEGDIPMEVVKEIVSTITDPEHMLGPEVREHFL
jgi:hypothetical protein